MGASLTEHDRDLADNFALEFLSVADANDVKALKDLRAANWATAGVRILFQFPPKITSDGRKGTWKETEAMGVEPIAVFSTSGPREISITATYIVDGTHDWTADRIHEQLMQTRGYFARVRSVLATTRNLAVKLKMWNIGGPKVASARLINVGVKYSDTLVGPPKKAFPLRTDLTLDIRLWTQGAGESGAEELQKITGLDPIEQPDWY